MRYRNVAALLFAIAAVPAVAQEAEAPPPKKLSPPRPAYNWIEASYAINYIGVGDSRDRSDLGFRVGASAKLVEHVHAYAAYDSHDYNPDESEFVSAGLGAYWPLGRSTDIGVTFGYEQADFDGDVADGFGYGGSLRTMLTRRSELAIGFKRSDVSDDNFAGSGVTLDYTLDTAWLFLSVPLARKLDLTFRFENVDYFAEALGAAADAEGENHLIGLRLMF